MTASTLGYWQRQVQALTRKIAALEGAKKLYPWQEKRLESLKDDLCYAQNRLAFAEQHQQQQDEADTKKIRRFDALQRGSFVTLPSRNESIVAEKADDRIVTNRGARYTISDLTGLTPARIRQLRALMTEKEQTA